MKKPSFLLPTFMLPSVSDPVVEMWAKSLSEFNTKYLGVLTVLQFMPTLYRDQKFW